MQILKTAKNSLKKFSAFLDAHKTPVALLVTALFVALQIPFILNHEPWYDEVVPWELSKQITPGNYYEINSAEPHPPLWQFILAPFSKLGAPIEILSFISLFFIALAVFLLWRTAPMKPLPKLIVTLSIVFFYFNPVIARDYCLIPLATILALLAYKSRFSHPLRYSLTLVFLMETHFLAWGLAGALALDFICGFLKRIFDAEKPQKSTQLEKTHAASKSTLRAPKLTLLKFFLFIIPLVLTVLSCIPIIIGCQRNHMIMSGTYTSTPNPLEFFDYFNKAAFGTNLPLFELALIPVLIFLLVRHTKFFFLSLLSLGYMYFVMLTSYNGYVRLAQKTSVFFMVIFAMFWLTEPATEPAAKSARKPSSSSSADLASLAPDASIPSENPLAKRLQAFFKKSELLRLLGGATAPLIFTLPFLLTIPNTFSIASRDLTEDYDASKTTAKKLNTFPENSVFIVPESLNQAFFVSADPFLTEGRVFYDLLTDSLGLPLAYDNALYDRISYGISDDFFASTISRLSETYEHIYYIADRPTCANAKPSHYSVLEKFTEVDTLTLSNFMSTQSGAYIIYQIR